MDNFKFFASCESILVAVALIPVGIRSILVPSPEIILLELTEMLYVELFSVRRRTPWPLEANIDLDATCARVRSGCAVCKNKLGFESLWVALFCNYQRGFILR